MSLSSHPSNSVKALEEIQGTESSQWPGLKLHPSFLHHWTPETVGLLFEKNISDVLSLKPIFSSLLLIARSDLSSA